MALAFGGRRGSLDEQRRRFDLQTDSVVPTCGFVWGLCAVFFRVGLTKFSRIVLTLGVFAFVCSFTRVVVMLGVVAFVCRSFGSR
jgi:hypothetical protein